MVHGGLISLKLRSGAIAKAGESKHFGALMGWFWEEEIRCM